MRIMPPFKLKSMHCRSLLLMALTLTTSVHAATIHVEHQVFKLPSDQSLIVDYVQEGAGSSATLSWFYLDVDTDGDGIPNFLETGAADDLDGDTIPNSSDTDDDGDGILDVNDNAANSGLTGKLMPASAFENGTAAAAAGNFAGDYMQWIPTDTTGGYYTDPSVYIYIDEDANSIPDALEYTTGSNVVPPLALTNEFTTTHIVEGGGFPGLLGLSANTGRYSGDVIFKILDDDGGSGSTTDWNSYSPYAGTANDTMSNIDGNVDYLIYGTSNPASQLIPFALKNPDGTFATDGNSQELYKYRYIGPVVSSSREIVFCLTVYWNSGGSRVNTYYSRGDFNPDVAPSIPTLNGATTGDDFGETTGGVSNNWFPGYRNTSNHDTLASAYTSGSITTWTGIATAPTDGTSPVAVSPGDQSWVDLWENWRTDRRILQYMGINSWLDSSPANAEQVILNRYGVDLDASSDNVLVRTDTTPNHFVLAEPSGSNGLTVLGVEDLFGLGDRDFEDYTVIIPTSTVSVDELLTANTTPTITGNYDGSVASISIVVYDSSASNVSSGSASLSSGTWSYAVGSALADGLYEIVATTNTSRTDLTITELVVDNTPPTGSAPTDAGTYTNNTTVTFNWTEPTDSLSGVETVVLQVGTTPGASNVFNGDVTGTTSQNITGSNGQTYYARLVATDAVGNVFTSGNSDGITVDTGLPTVFTPNDSGTYTQLTNVSFNWTYPLDSLSGIGSLTLQVGTSPGGNDIFDGDVTGNISQLVTGSDGDSLYARLIAVDNAGNSRTSANSNGITIDTGDPVASVPTDAGVYTNSTSVTINWAAPSDSISGVASSTLQVGTTPGGNDIFDGDVTGNTSQIVTGANGDTIYARLIVTDNASNSTTTGNSDGITIDTVDPIASVPTDAGVYTNSTSVTINWAAPSDSISGVASSTLQVGTTPGGNDIFDGDVTGNTSQIVTGANGDTIYARLIVTDNASNSTTTGNSDGIMIDTVAPTSLAGVGDASQADGDIDNGNFVTSDVSGSGVASVVLYVKEPLQAWTNAGTVTGGTWTFTPSAAGRYEFTTVATDNASNTETAPTGSDAGQVAVIYNPSSNADFTYATVSDGAYIYPMTDDLDVVLTFSGGASGGPITVNRTVGDATPAAGYDAARLIDEYISIQGNLTGGEASIQWNFDPASDDGLTGSFDSVFQFESGVLVNQFPVTPSGTTLTIPGVTSFSDWWAGDATSSVNDWMTLERE